MNINGHRIFSTPRNSSNKHWHWNTTQVEQLQQLHKPILESVSHTFGKAFHLNKLGLKHIPELNVNHTNGFCMVSDQAGSELVRSWLELDDEGKHRLSWQASVCSNSVTVVTLFYQNLTLNMESIHYRPCQSGDLVQHYQWWCQVSSEYDELFGSWKIKSKGCHSFMELPKWPDRFVQASQTPANLITQSSAI